MRMRHVLWVGLLLVVGNAFAATPASDIDALADAIGLPAPGPVFIGDDEQIDGSSRTRKDVKKAARLADLPRRAGWAAGWLCAERSDFACALTQWHALAQSAASPPRWLPEAYALALWGLGRHEQAVAWYDTAVLAAPHLGNARLLPGRFFGASLYSTAQELFVQWSERLAPLRKSVITAVDIAADGQVERVQVLDEQLDPALARRIQQVVAEWRFPRNEDQASPAQRSTHVYTEVRGRPDGEQRMVFDIQFTGMGVRAVHRAGPIYPKAALALRQEGVSVVRVDLDSSGKVLRARIDESSGTPSLDQAAVTAARRWRFAMDRIDGKPVASYAKLPFAFVIGTEASMPPLGHGRRSNANDRAGIVF